VEGVRLLHDGVMRRTEGWLDHATTPAAEGVVVVVVVVVVLLFVTLELQRL
jgi:hypothetical protein